MPDFELADEPPALLWQKFVSLFNWTDKTPVRSIVFRFVQMFARRQVGVFFKMFRAQRLGNDVLAAEPFSQVNQFAALGTKRPELPGEPVAGFFADRAFDLRIVSIWFPLQSF